MVELLAPCAAIEAVRHDAIAQLKEVSVVHGICLQYRLFADWSKRFP